MRRESVQPKKVRAKGGALVRKYLAPPMVGPRGINYSDPGNISGERGIS
jgi:hypothetical protein